MEVKGIKRYYVERAGRWYTYHRASGTRLKAEFGSPEFFAELAAIEAKHKGEKPKPRVGTLGAAIGAYQRSPAWTGD